MASSARIDEIKKKFDENPRRYFAPLANEFRKAGDLEQAILICEEFLPQQAGHMSGHIVYGQALYEAGRMPESKTVFETALGLDPENLIALRHLGDIARSQGDPADARQWYDRVLEADPRNDEIQGLLQSLEADAGQAIVEPGMPSLAPPHAAPPVPAEAHTARPELSPIDLDLDDGGFATPAPASSAIPPAPSHPADALSPWSAVPPETAGFAVSGLEATSNAQREPAERPDTMHGRAAGLEPAEFEVPSLPTSRAEGLEPSEFQVPLEIPVRAEGLETAEFESSGAESTDGALLDLEGSFAAETHSGAPDAGIGADAVSGLEEAGATHPDEPHEVALPMLDMDDGFTVAPHGDAVTHPGAATADAHHPAAHDPRMDPPAAMEAMPALTDAQPDGGEEAPAMMELSPQVLAAESELMDVPDEYGFADEEAEPAPAMSAGRAPFVTETMAELYLKQGFAAQALNVYRQLSQESPSDARLRDRVASLEAEAARAPAAHMSGPSVRDFFFRLATRRPHERAAEATPPSAADFASFDAVPEFPGSGAARASAADQRSRATPEASTPHAVAETHALPAVAAPMSSPPPTAAPMPSAAARGATAQGGAGSTGSIDALFGGRTASAASSDSAASALAQAFGGTSDAPVISGRAAHTAAGELSLDSVFRDGAARPPRISQGFAFDQFFSEGAADAAAPATPAAAAAEGEPAERGADEVKQFNSWLQGLKPR